MCYYTITTNIEDKEGRLQAIMIIDAIDEEMAKREYIKTFKQYSFEIKDGIHIEKDFADLVTPYAKRFITKALSKKTDLPLVSYSNCIHVKHDDDK